LVIEGNYDESAIDDGRQNQLCCLFVHAMHLDDFSYAAKVRLLKVAFLILEKANGMLLMKQNLAEYFLEILVGQIESQVWQQEMVEPMLEALLDVVGKLQAEAEGVKWLKQRKETPQIIRLMDQMEERSQRANAVAALLLQILEDTGEEFE
jgi:hypothetical protein